MEDITTSRRAPFGTNPTVGEAGRATQQRILAAANDAFAATGYARTSVEAITDIAGCSRPTFYQYFSGKEDLHRRLAARFGAELLEVLDRMGPITPDRRGRDEIASWLTGLAAVHARYRAVADNFAAAVRTDDQMVTGSVTLSAAYRSRLCDVIVDPPADPVALEVQAVAINSVAYGASVYRRRVGSVTDARATDALTDLIPRSIFGAIDGINIGESRPGTGRRTPGQTRATNPDDERRQARGMATRTKLMDAAAAAFGTLGYEGVRVDDIAVEAGVSHGTFYRYYRDKDAVFSEHVDAATDEIVELLASWPLAAGTEAPWASDYFDLFARHGGIIGCLPEARAAGLDAATRSRLEVSRALRTGLDARSFGDTDADIVSCFALLEGFPASAFRGLGISVEDAINTTALILRRGVFGASA
ncbi:MAG: TetR/AcrR family transcriptional regulator [Acidimicrobiales bacterium]